MATYIYTPNGLQNTSTGEIEPWNRDAPPVLPRIDTSDDQEPLVSMADGQTYTSKAKMRESYKASNNPRGKEFIEVGDDPKYLKPTHNPQQPRKEDIAKAYDKAEAAIARGEFDHIQ